jgi:hypothetical protein
MNEVYVPLGVVRSSKTGSPVEMVRCKPAPISAKTTSCAMRSVCAELRVIRCLMRSALR